MNSTDLRTAKPQTPEGDEWLSNLWREEWGGETMVSKGETYHISELSSVIAWHGERRVGAATYRFGDDGCELVSINAVAGIHSSKCCRHRSPTTANADLGEAQTPASP